MDFSKASFNKRKSSISIVTFVMVSLLRGSKQKLITRVIVLISLDYNTDLHFHPLEYKNN